MRIVAVSDFDNGFSVSKIIPKIKKAKPELIILHGDLCYAKEMRKILFSNWNEIQNSEKKWFNYTTKKRARDLVKHSLAQGEHVIKSLASLGVPMFVVYGNNEAWDYRNLTHEYYRNRFDKIIKKYKNVYSIEFTHAEFGGINFIGYGNFNSSPEYDNLNYTEFFRLRKFLKAYKKLFSKQMPNILISHNVPFNTKLDLIKNPESPRNNEHVGSKYVRKLILKFNPILSIHGHMHETQGKVKIKETTCINTGIGSEGQFAIIDIKDSKAKVKFNK